MKIYRCRASAFVQPLFPDVKVGRQRVLGERKVCTGQETRSCRSFTGQVLKKTFTQIVLKERAIPGFLSAMMLCKGTTALSWSEVASWKFVKHPRL